MSVLVVCMIAGAAFALGLLVGFIAPLVVADMGNHNNQGGNA